MAKVRVSITLKLFENDGVTNCTTRRVKSRIIVAAQVKSWDKAYIKVVYDQQKGHYNEAMCNDMDDLKFFLSGFTEKSLINYIKGKE